MVEGVSKYPELDKIVTREEASRNMSLSDLATNFEGVVRSSKGFLWMGVVAEQDPEMGTSVDVYLSQRSTKRLSTRIEKAVADVIDDFTDLGMALEESGMIANLHLVTTSEMRLGQLRQKLIDSCRGTNRSLVYHQSLR